MRKFSTESIHGHGFRDQDLGTIKVPLYLSAIFEHPDRRTGKTRKSDRGFEQKYSREENPTVRALEKVVAKLERGVEALAFNSGMGAIATTYISSFRSGDTVVMPKECYGTTQELALNLSKFGVKTILAGPETDDFIQAIKKGVNFVLVETVTNPLLRVVDVREIAKHCNDLHIRLVVDNTFAAAISYNPLPDGAWAVVHSTTKYMAGHNDAVGGALVLNDALDLVDLWEFRRRLGSIMSPFEAFLTMRGIATLKVRFESQCRSAMEIAEFLQSQPKVESVYYPGLKDNRYHGVASRLLHDGLYGGVVSFKIKGGEAETLRVLKHIDVVTPSPSLGGVESLLNYPLTSASKTLAPAVRKELGITDNLLRLSIGLEDVEDLKEDLAQAISKA